MAELARNCLDPEEVRGFVQGALPAERCERVESHVDDCADCRALLAEIARSSLADGGGSVATAHTLRDSRDATAETLLDRPGPPAAATRSGSAPVPGSRIDRYIVLRPLGEGGMGVVSLARDPELRRKVVIKLVRPEIADPSDTLATRTRLLREAQAMAQVSHPNVVPIYDVGVHEGRVFLAMEFVDGKNLADWLRDRQRTTTDVLSAFVDAGRGLAAAHAAGLIHRDFKPHNVMVGKAGQVKVTDFGLARSEPGARAVASPRSQEMAAVAEPAGKLLLQSPLTRTGAMVGTPAYMAPEQIEGGTVDHRSDQFSFCVALYQALFGSRPYAGDTVGEILESARERRVLPPQRTPRLRKRVVDALWRGLSAEPDQRFSSMTALLDELAPPTHGGRWAAAGVLVGAASIGVVLAVSSPNDPPPSPGPDSALCTGSEKELADIWGPDRRRQAMAGLSSAGAQAVAHDLASALDRYAQSWITMHRENCEATRVRGEQTETIMAGRLACLNRRRIDLRLAAEELRAETDPSDAELLRGNIAALPAIETCTADRLDDELMLPQDLAGRTVVMSLRLKLSAADLMATANKHDLATTSAREVIAQARAIPYPPLEAEALIKLGRYQMVQSEWSTAAATMTEAVQLADMAKHHRAKAEAQLALIHILRRLGRHDEAERYLRYARSSLTATGSVAEAEIELCGHLAEAFIRQGNLHEAIAQHQRALQLTEEIHGRDSVQVARAVWAMADVLTMKAGRYTDAIPLLQRARDIYDRQTSDEKLNGLTVRMQLQAALHYAGKFDEAVAVGREVLEIAGDDGLWASGALPSLAMSLHSRGDREQAFQTIERALSLSESISGKDSAGYMGTLGVKANILAADGRYAEAEALLHRVLSVWEPVLGADDSGTINVRNAIATMRIKQNRGVDAIDWVRDSLQRLDRQADPDVPLIAGTLERLARAYVSAGRPKEAVAPAERALGMWEGRLAPPDELGVIKFSLALALWDSGKDRSRARKLAREALAALDPAISRERAQVEKWLAAHSR